MKFKPWQPLIAGGAGVTCRAVVVIPVRNEEVTLLATLNALAGQVDGAGRPLDPQTFEALFFLNNCTDGSEDVARQWMASHPRFAFHLCCRTLPKKHAHVGTARRLLMDTAWQRLRFSREPVRAMLSSDADTIPATDWIFRNLEAIRAGADAVGGAIDLQRDPCRTLPHAVRRAHRLDLCYQHLVAELEDRLDPQRGDRAPRHLQHFGASLACTPEIYARAGGIPVVSSLEDVAFVDALRRVDAKLRHDPAVVVATSARMRGRMERGLSVQLRLWKKMADNEKMQRVLSADYLVHRFQRLRSLREIYCGAPADGFEDVPRKVTRALAEAQARKGTCGKFLAVVQSERLIDITFRGKRESGIAHAIESLRKRLTARDLAAHDLWRNDSASIEEWV